MVDVDESVVDVESLVDVDVESVEVDESVVVAESVVEVEV